MSKTKIYCSLSVTAVKLRRKAPSPQRGEGWGEGNRIRKNAFKIPLSLALSLREREVFLIARLPWRQPGKLTSWAVLAISSRNSWRVSLGAWSGLIPALLPVSKKAFKPLCWNDLIMLQLYCVAFHNSILFYEGCLQSSAFKRKPAPVDERGPTFAQSRLLVTTIQTPGCDWTSCVYFQARYSLPWPWLLPRLP